MLSKSRLITLIFTTLSLSYSPYTSAQAPHWGYSGETGPTHWGELSKEYALCATGQQQSPIDITNSTQADLADLTFDYKSIPLTIENNGHTIKVSADQAGQLKIGEDSYQLVQFHTHTPSETAIDGHRLAMVVHLVHQNTAGQLAVVAVLFKSGEANPLLEKMLTVLPQTEGAAQTHQKISIDINQLLPEDKHYYTYTGSLTTPPCTEGVKWVVMKQPITLSEAQKQQFEGVHADNARPLQPLNDRDVLSSSH